MKAELLYYSGDDLTCCNAARVSFDKESEWEERWYDEGKGCETWLSDKDTKLIHYLASHNHLTPFMHNSITLRMTAPIPIRTQCFKHKVGFVENEISRRYVDYVPEVYLPEFFRLKADNKKQGSSEETKHMYCFDTTYAGEPVYPDDLVDLSLRFYNVMIEKGVCPEQARFILPQGAMTTWIWTGSLAAYARFYNLRTSPDAQKEIQDLAHMVGDIIEPLFPVSWKALTNG